MAFKIEMNKDKETGITAFAFECNSVNDHEVLDCLRVALLGGHPTRGGYVTSDRLVIEVKVPESQVELTVPIES